MYFTTFICTKFVQRQLFMYYSIVSYIYLTAQNLYEYVYWVITQPGIGSLDTFVVIS